VAASPRRSSAPITPDLHARRDADRGAAHERGSGVRQAGLPLHQVALAEWEGSCSSTWPGAGAVRARVRAARGAIQAASTSPPCARGGPHRLRRARQLEARVSEFFPNACTAHHSPGTRQADPYTSGENDLFDGPYLGGYMVITAPGGKPDHERAGVRTAVGDPAGGRPESGLLLHDISQPAAVAPPGLRDVPHAVAAVARPYPHHVRVLFHPDAFGQPASIRTTRCASGTRPTGRTGTSASRATRDRVAGLSTGPYSPREGISAAWDREFLRAIGHARP